MKKRAQKLGRIISKNTTIVIPDPGPGEVVVNIQACGVCHTDLHANNVLVEVVWDPPWNPDMMSDAAKEKLGIA